MSKTMTLACRSGAYDCHTPPSQAHLLLPSVNEQFKHLKAEIERKTNQRLIVKSDPQRFTDWAVGLEYRNLGQEIHQLHQQLKALKTQFKQQTDESFDSMFVRAAKNMLPPDEFEQLKRYAWQLLDEFRDNTHLEITNESL